MYRKLINIAYSTQSDAIHKCINSLIKELCKEIKYEVYDEDNKEYEFTQCTSATVLNIRIIGDIEKDNESIINIISTKLKKLKEENKAITYNVKFSENIMSLN